MINDVISISGCFRWKESFNHTDDGIRMKSIISKNKKKSVGYSYIANYPYIWAYVLAVYHCIVHTENSHGLFLEWILIEPRGIARYLGTHPSQLLLLSQHG